MATRMTTGEPVYIGGLSRTSSIGLAVLTGVYPQVLGAMPVQDVVREGGKPGESPLEFMKRMQKYFGEDLTRTVTVIEFVFFPLGTTTRISVCYYAIPCWIPV